MWACSGIGARGAVSGSELGYVNTATRSPATTRGLRATPPTALGARFSAGMPRCYTQPGGARGSGLHLHDDFDAPAGLVGGKGESLVDIDQRYAVGHERGEACGLGGE